jgi:hypothetical protein
MLDSTDDWVDRNSGYDFLNALAGRDPALRRWVMASPRRALASDFGRLAVARLGGGSANHAPVAGRPRLYRVDVVEPGASGNGLVFPQGARVARVAIVDGIVELELDLEPALGAQLGVATSALLRFTPDELRRAGAGLDSHSQETFVARLAGWLEQSGVSTPETRRLIVAARAAQIARHQRHLLDEQRQAEALRAMIAGSPRLGRLGRLASPLDEAIERADLGAYADEIRGLALPCFTLVPEAGGVRAPLGASRLGGRPDLPATMLWPRVGGAYLSFVAQLDLASLPPLPESPLPPAGLLSFFLGASELAKDIEHRVLLVEDAALVRARLPAGAPMREDLGGPAGYDPVVPRIATAVSLPGYGSRLPRQLSFADDDAAMERYHELVESLGGSLEYGKSLLLGHADGDELEDVIDAYAARAGLESPRYLDRGSIEDDVAQAREAGDRLRAARAAERLARHEWWQANALEVAQKSHEWRLLLSLNSHAETGMCFWDAGTLNFYVHVDDLRARRFDRTRATIVTS